MIKYSVIIPTYNEARTIKNCLARFENQTLLEVIIADSPNSSDKMEELALAPNIKLLKCQEPGRNKQMNEAALKAKGEILYFVHADTQVPASFLTDLNTAIANGADMGCYRYKFDQYPNPLMYINSFFTRFDKIWCRGGDQTLFIKKEVFDALKGFCAKHIIMEDYDIIKRSKGKFKFTIIPKNVIVSARKYQKNSYLKVQWANYRTMSKYLSGQYSPEELLSWYKEKLS